MILITRIELGWEMGGGAIQGNEKGFEHATSQTYDPSHN